LLELLDSLRVSYAYRLQARNTRYDGNLRGAIDLASGQFCFLLGNDDSLATPTTLEELHRRMLARQSPAVVITNYQDYASGTVTKRVKSEQLLGAGPLVAARNFRNVSFLSGVVLNGPAAKDAATDRWDGSEFYQMYLASKLTADGGLLLTLDLVTVRKDIHIAGDSVDSYRSKPDPSPNRIVERPFNVVTIGRVVIDGIRPSASGSQLQRLSVDIFLQLLVFTYPYWVFEYRRVKSWKYAAGVCLTMRPRRMLEGQTLSPARRWLIVLVYALVTVTSLLMPVMWFMQLTPRLHRLAKSFRQVQPAAARSWS
jgi:hypothetical protein